MRKLPFGILHGHMLTLPCLAPIPVAIITAPEHGIGPLANFILSEKMSWRRPSRVGIVAAVRREIGRR